MRFTRKSILLTLLFSLTISSVSYADISQDTVEQVQTKLNELGYDCGTPDGIVGQHTAEAVMKYQSDNKLETTGTIDDELLDSLGIVNVDALGISLDTFVKRYNDAIGEYNQVAERDCYTNAPSISRETISVKSKDYSLDDYSQGYLTLNNGEDNSGNMVDEFSFYSYLEGSYDIDLITGETIACIYALDKSLQSFDEAGNLYSQLMEADSDTLDNGNIHYLNGSIEGFFAIRGSYVGSSSAEVEETDTLLTEETTDNSIDISGDIETSEEQEESKNLSTEESSDKTINVDTSKEFDSFLESMNKSCTVFEDFAGLKLEDYPSKNKEKTDAFVSVRVSRSSEPREYTVYTIDNCSFLNYPCSFRIWSSPSFRTYGIIIDFDNNLTNSDVENITNTMKEYLTDPSISYDGIYVDIHDSRFYYSFYTYGDGESHIAIDPW